MVCDWSTSRNLNILDVCWTNQVDETEFRRKVASRRRGLKVNAGKSKAMVMNVEEGLECEVHEDGIRLEHVSEFKYLVCFGRIRYRWGRV